MIYTISGEVPKAVYSCDGTEAMSGYNKNGVLVYESMNQYLPNRYLAFEDDFNGDSIDENSWSFNIGNYNNEKQYYRKENATVEDSCLVITAKRESFGGREWTSARVITGGKNGWKYGRFEAKIKFPGTVGSFPAFWLMGFNNREGRIVDRDHPGEYNGNEGSVPWPLCGELDIVEYIPGNSMRPIGTVWPGRAYDSSFHNLFQVTPDYDIDPTEWHVYSVDISEDHITYYIDNLQIGSRMVLANYTQSDIEAYRKPLYILLNLAISNGEPTVDEMKMYVDWVRVYAPEGVTSEIQAESISLPSEMLMESGLNYFIQPTFTPDNVSDRRVKWYSTDPSVAEEYDGIISAYKNGTTDIIAIAKNKKIAMSTITVRDAEN